MQATFKLVKLEPWHLASIEVQDHQKYFEVKCKDPAYRVALAKEGGITGLLDNGPDVPPTIVGIAGIMTYEEGVGMGWSVLSKHFPKYARRITRLVKEHCKEQLQTTYHRIEIQTQDDFAPANRWAEMLGFEFEAIRKQASPHRKDMRVYTMLRED